MDESKIGEVELIISKSLRIGVMLSAVIILVGLLMFLVSGNSGYPGTSYPTTIKEILRGLLLLKPYGIIMTGLLILIITPIFRVGVSIIVFFKEKDYLYVKITTLVFIILIFSFMLGKVG
jgi:Predicted membrane protein